MPKTVTPLTDTKCDAAKPATKDYYLFDGGGLVLLVRSSGTRVWQYKFKRPNGKDGRMTLGRYPALRLKAARIKRLELETLLAEGIDPIDQQKAVRQKAEAIKPENLLTLEKVAREWHAAYAASSRGWKDGQAELRRLENHLFLKKLSFPATNDAPAQEIANPLCTMSISDIKTRDLLPAFNAMDKQGISTTLERVRGMTVKIFDYAILKNYIDNNNPAYTLRNAVLNAPDENNHRPALPLRRIPELLQRIDQYRGQRITKLCTLILLNTFLRSSEGRFAHWTEIHFDEKLWIVPAVREAVLGAKHSERGTKMGRTGYVHLVPLSPQVIGYLKELQELSGDTKYLFPKLGSDHGFISEGTVNQALQRMGYLTHTGKNAEGVTGDVCLHGFRTMARSAIEDARLFTRDAIRAQMSHKYETNKDELDVIYGRMAQHLDERFKLMRWWSDWLDANRHEYIRPFKFSHPDEAEPDADLRELLGDVDI
ncbi:MAG: integrase arm-type DNA-binding domain-containing protein [Gammaproteobacteria bacterium]|nr:integrase arm-type DNA-binding domain-containing protein [Gammaproteobacteria bacterium]